jgi:hypothetical protein
MKKIVRLKESDLTNIIKKVISEQHHSPSQELRMTINDLLDNDFRDIDPSEAAQVFEYFAKAMRGNEYRKKHNIGPISKDEVIKNFKKHKGGSF